MLTRRTTPNARRPLPGRRLLALVALAAATLAFPVGCETSGAGMGPARSPQVRRKAFPIVHEDYRALGFSLDWVGFPTVLGRQKIEHLVLNDDIVATLEGGSTVTVLSATNGQVRWADQLSNRLGRFVGLNRDGNKIYASGENEVFVLDLTTGNLLDRQRYEKIVSTPPVQYGNLLIYGASVGEVLAHMIISRIDGVKVWGHAVAGSVTHSPVLIGSVIGAVSQGGVVVFLDAATGSVVGSNRVYKGLATDPVASDSLMFVACLDQSLYAFNPVGGSLVWRQRTPVPLRHQPTVRGGTLYCAVDGNGLVAFETGTGNVIWTAKGVLGSVIGVSRGRLVVWDGVNASLLDASRGDVIASVKLPNVRYLKMDRFEEGNLYAVSESGVIAKFVAR